MTPAQNLEYEILNTEAKLHGLRFEMAAVTGDLAASQKHLAAMKDALGARDNFIGMTHQTQYERDLETLDRIEKQNECFFDVMGEIHAAQLKTSEAVRGTTA